MISGMRKLFFLSAFLLSMGLEAQPGCLSGKVTDAKTGEDVPFALVYLKESQAGGQADIHGNYRIKNVPAGKHRLVCSSVGYKKEELEVDLVPGDSLRKDFKLQPVSYEAGEVVITGTQREVYVAESPVKIEVLTWKQLQKVPAGNMMEALQTVNGVQEQINCGVCNTSDIHINGMEGPYTLVLIDGMPVMSALASVYGLNGIPSSIISRIEIIKGPSTAIYGTEAMAGVINIVTKRAEQLPLTGFNSFISSHGESNVDFFVAPRKEKYSLLLSGNYAGMNTFIDENGDGFSDVALAQRFSLFNKWAFRMKGGRYLTLSGKAYYEDRWGGQRGWTKELRGSDSVYAESIYTHRAELIGNLPLPFRKQDMQLDFSFNAHNQDSRYGKTPYLARQGTAFASLTWRKKAGRHDLASGLQFRFNGYDDNTPATLQASLQAIPGLYLHDELKLGERWLLLPGLRFDYQDEHGWIMSPRVNVKFDAAKNLAFRFNSGNGFRTVNLFTEEHAALSGSRTVIVREALKPEQSWNASLNANYVFKLRRHFFTADADVFCSYYSNRILPDYETDQDLIIYQNLDGFSVSKGVSFSLSHSWNQQLRLHAGATMMDVQLVSADSSGQYRSGPQLFTPRFSGVFSVSWQIEKWHLTIDYSGKVIGPMELPGFAPPFQRPTRSDWFSLQHVQLTEAIGKRWEVYGAVKNLLNFTQDSPLIDPQHPFGDAFDTTYAWGPLQGRRFVIGVRFKAIR